MQGETARCPTAAPRGDAGPAEVRIGRSRRNETHGILTPSPDPGTTDGTLSRSSPLDSLLAYAVFLDDLEDVQDLLLRGADPDARDEEGRPVVMLAVMNQSRAITLALLEAGADVDARDSDGWTSLQVAVQRRLHDAAGTLLRFGCDVNLADHDGTTALARAVRICCNDEPFLGLLRRHGADPDLADARGWTAARLAGRRGIVLPPCTPSPLH